MSVPLGSSDPGVVRPPHPARDRFWFEDPDDDFPFYNGRPRNIGGRQWLFVLATVAFGFALLTTRLLAPAGGAAPYLAAILFPVVPVIGLALVAPGHWRAIFRRVGWRGVMWMFLIAALNLVVSLCVALALNVALPMEANTAIAGLPALSATDQVLFFARTAPQLFGEEVVTILPFLAALHLLATKARFSRRHAVIGAWLLSAAWFAALHLPTYGWNFLQCFVVIGSARLVLSLAYIKTKNIWVSTGAHIINDWALFAGIMVLAVLK